MLDTNIISDLIRNPQGTIFSHIEAVGEDHIVTDVIVAAELRYGAIKKGSPALIERIDMILSRIKVLSLEPGVDETYGRIRDHLERRGTPIGANDLLIAAHVLHMHQKSDWALITANVNEFERVEGLTVENWLK